MMDIGFDIPSSMMDRLPSEYSCSNADVAGSSPPWPLSSMISFTGDFSRHDH
jgi:hypothetical protein